MKGGMMKHMEKSAQLDRHGKMPDLTDMLNMRSNKEAYRFYWMVFGPHVYGKAATERTSLRRS